MRQIIVAVSLFLWLASPIDSLVNVEFDNYGACMRLVFSCSCLVIRIPEMNVLAFSVSEDLLCAFELLKPLDGAALRKEMTKAKRKR